MNVAEIKSLHESHPLERSVSKGFAFCMVETRNLTILIPREPTTSQSLPSSL